MAQANRERKKDYEALQSPFMRIPQMKIDVARGLLNIGVTQIYHLEGRSPESLLAEMEKAKAELRDDVIAYLRMAVYFAENQPPDASKLYPTVWM
ncbi:helix-hairpin-helix domain-containing protein [Cerasicoccus fimbriatus]|uniref:helix-hairpin-helix domain-containing protein n=1 Tax=Cerasicoccus fimbriatus TaxID=3014554 RepID=UPI0022B42A5E|nr:helix-hairpin-helix domain-containing protein [Cerasicoccus sp. TK19100]